MNCNLNLLVTFYSDHYQDSDSQNRSCIKNITWSPFDRVFFRSVTSLKELCGYYRFFNTTNKASEELEYGQEDELEEKRLGTCMEKIVQEDSNKERWNGVMQSMHLVEECFDTETQLDTKWSIQADGNQNYIFEVTKSDVKFDFYCIYSMRFSNEIQNLRLGEQVWNKKAIREQIFKKVSAKIEKKEIVFKCFRSLGSEDMVIIFLANSMNDIVSIGNYISGLQIKFPEHIMNQISKSSSSVNQPIQLISTICVFSGLNNSNCNKYIDTDLIMHINLKKSSNSEVVVEKIKGEMKKIVKHKMIDELSSPSDISGGSITEVISVSQPNEKILDNWFVFLGIGALIVHIPANTIKYCVFHGGKNGGIFNGESDFYMDNIYSSRTYFCLAKSDNDGSIIDMSGLTDEIYCNDAKREKDTEQNNYNENGNEVASFIFDEYERLISSQRTTQWHGILSRQRDIVKSFSKYYFSLNNKFLACDLLNYAQSSLHLINQACSPVSEIPNHNHFYSGSFHDIIKAYYGIIGMIFNIGRSLPHDLYTFQHNIDFAICLNATARIESKIFTRKDSKTRFVIFFLPYDDFWNFSGNIKLLIHEVFHYIAPYSRKIRANHFVKIMFSMLVNERINWLYYNKFKEGYCSSDVKITIGKWKDWLIKHYDKNVEKDLLDNLQKHFPDFFICSNPEWSLRYLNYATDDTYPSHGGKKTPQSRDEIRNIMSTIDNDVQNYINNSCDEAFKQLNEVSLCDGKHICDMFTPNFIKDSFYSQDKSKSLSFTEHWEKVFKSINSILRRYNLATKEAFCDIWSILISELTIPEYIAVVLDKMAEVNPKGEIITALESRDLRSTKLDIRATIIRLLLLIHKYFKDNLNETITDYDSSLKGIFYNILNKRKEDNYICRCISALTAKYKEFIKIGKYEIDSLCKIAFYGVDKSFKIITKINPRGCCEAIRSANKIDLTSNIGMDAIDMFSNFIDDPFVKENCESDDFPFKEQVLKKDLNYNCNNEGGRYKMQISSIADLLDSIKEIKNKIAPNSNQPRTLWYRGVCSDKFSLLPSIFRKGNSDISIYANQANVIKRAYFSTLYAADIWNLPIEQKMAYLQHYGMPTNLLDFSIDPFVALHFALNPDVISDRQNVNNGKFQPVIYVFDPIIYGQAIRKMFEYDPTLKISDSISAVEFDINNNRQKKSPFFVDDMSYEYLSEHNNKHLKKYTPNDRGDPFPVPIVIQQSNMRIAAQSGTFVAFSLDALPQRGNGEDKFDYLNLLTIQERYTRFINKTTNYDSQFIFPIYLQKNYISLFKEELMALNINTGKFYPELSKIFEDTVSQGLNDSI